MKEMVGYTKMKTIKTKSKFDIGDKIYTVSEELKIEENFIVGIMIYVSRIGTDIDYIVNENEDGEGGFSVADGDEGVFDSMIKVEKFIKGKSK